MIKEKIVDMVNKIDQFSKKSSEKNSATKVHTASLANLVFMPLGILLRNWKSFLALGTIFAIIMSILAFSTHNILLCSFKIRDNSPFACPSDSNTVYITFLFLRLLLIAVFMRSWYKIAINRETVFIKDILVINLQDWKLFTVLILFFAINTLPIVSFALLSSRVPNPNWIIETIYFGIVSCGFWVPLVLIKFYSVPAFVIEQQPFPGVKKTFQKTADMGLRLLSSVALIFLFCALLIIYYNAVAGGLLEYNLMIFGIMVEFVYNLVLLAVFAITINYSAVQKKELFNDSKAS